MSEPIKCRSNDISRIIRNAINEIHSGISSLHMYPDHDKLDKEKYIADQVSWVKHSVEHMRFVIKELVRAESEFTNLRFKTLMAARDGEISWDTYDKLFNSDCEI